MSNYPNDGEPVTRRSGTSPMMVFFIIIGSCLVGGVIVVGALAALLYPVFSQSQGSRRASCLSNVKQLATGLMMYTQDYDDKMPPAASWGTNLIPYTKNMTLFICPQRRGLSSGYAFNQKLSGRATKKIASTAAAPMLFESSLGYANAFDQLQSFVAPHNGTGNVGFADGHAKALSTAPPANAGLQPAPKQVKPRDGRM
jgi:prepilin-type processing-associated H-X9-DG protein